VQKKAAEDKEKQKVKDTAAEEGEIEEEEEEDKEKEKKEEKEREKQKEEKEKEEQKVKDTAAEKGEVEEEVEEDKEKEKKEEKEREKQKEENEKEEQKAKDCAEEATRGEENEDLNGKSAATTTVEEVKLRAVTPADMEKAFKAKCGVIDSVDWTKYLSTNSAGKWIVHWAGLLQELLAGRADLTTSKINNFKDLSIGRSATSFWGENWKGSAGAKDKKRLVSHMQSFTAMNFNPRGEAVPDPGVPDKVKLFPLLIAISLQRFCAAAKNAFVQAVKDGTGLLNWAHGAQHAPYVQKLICKVLLPSGEYSRPFPAYHGLADDLTTEEKTARGPSMEIPIATTEIQDLFDLQMTRLALRLGYKDTSAYITQALGGVVYHFTLNFMGGHTFDHNDEIDCDGPGWWIWNLVLQGSGLLYFLEEFKHNAKRLPMSGVWQDTGDCAGFSGDARVYMKHGVLRSPPARRLPATGAELTSTSLDNMRIVCSVRGGEVPETERQKWYGHWADSYDIADPYAEPITTLVAPTVHGHQAGVKRSTRKAKKSDSPIAVDDSPIAGGDNDIEMIDLRFAHLPKVGDVVQAGGNTTWGPSKVTQIISNFVLTNALPRSGKESKRLPLKAGMQVQLRLPSSGGVTLIHIVAVGMIFARTRGQGKYRAVVIRRQMESESTYGVLETLNAAAFPDRKHCNVHTATSKHTHTHYTISFLGYTYTYHYTHTNN
jgi:flagellar motor protein MotB